MEEILKILNCFILYVPIKACFYECRFFNRSVKLSIFI
jgi:hypothetical protein